jgi:hypothetical protein
MQSDVQTPALLRGGRIRQRSQGPAGRLSKRQAAAVRGDNIPPPHGRRHSLSSVHRCPPSQAPPRPTVHQRSRGQTNSNWSNEQLPMKMAFGCRQLLEHTTFPGVPCGTTSQESLLQEREELLLYYQWKRSKKLSIILLECSRWVSP